MNGEKFIKIGDDPTSSFEIKNSETSKKHEKEIKSSYLLEYIPNQFTPRSVYGTAKVHKMPVNSKNVDELSIRPIVSCLGTGTYEISQYLTKLLAPLAKSKYTVNNTKDSNFR